MNSLKPVMSFITSFNVNPKNIWIGYVVGCGLLVVLLSAGQLTAHWNAQVLQKYSDSTLQASKLSALNHLVLDRLHHLEANPASASFKEVSLQISKYQAQYNALDEQLSQTSIMCQIFGDQSEGIRAGFKKISSEFLAFSAAKLAVIAEGNETALHTDQHGDQHGLPDDHAAELAIEQNLLEAHLNIVVKLNELEREQINLANGVEFGFYLAALLLLAFEAIFIFWPSHIINANYISTNKEQKLELEKLTHDLNGQNRELREAYKRIGHDALHDALTGLANRRYLEQEIRKRINEEEANNKRYAVLHIDLDKFKRVNDTLGHKAGDYVLQFVARQLKDNLRDTDFAARIGGDEFAVISSGFSDRKTLSDFADRLAKVLKKSLLFEGSRCEVSASIGMDVVDFNDFDQKVDVNNLFARADLALYQAKENGGGCFELFTETILASHMKTKTLQDEIIKGLSANEFIPYYQLQYDAKTRKAVSAEALVRWRHPERGILPPSEFLEIANQMGLEQQIDRTILISALHDLKAWNSGKQSPIKSVAVNLSAKTIGDPKFMDMIGGLKIPKGKISFEITETVDINQNSHQIIENVEALKKQGFEVEIDDFGTGHASILCLQYLKPSRLKIDREFIFPIVECAEQRRLVKSIIELSRPYDVKVVAEGVESMEHAEILAKMGCDVFQGYAFCKPIPAIGVIALLSKEQEGKAAANIADMQVA